VRPGQGPALLLLVVAGPVAAALLGARGPARVGLNLGPGDFPYVHGFAPAYEIDDKVATHWTTNQARVELPLEMSGGPFELVVRLGRPLPETTDAVLAFAGRALEPFRARRVFEERRFPLGVLPPTPFRVDLQTRATEPLGLDLDWVEARADAEARIRLAGGTRWRPALAIAILFAVLWAAGWSPLAAAGLTAPVALAAAVALLRDPWLVHRLLTGIPEWLAGLGLVGVGAGRALRARGLVTAESLRAVTALAAAAFLLRALPLNHPDYYYPDLRSHARLAEVVRQAGLDFLRAPSAYIWEHGVWRKTAYGRSYAFPYSPAFHAPFALLPLSYDRIVTGMKLAAAAASAVPILALWSLSRRIGASPLGAALLVVIPIYGSHLAVAYVAAGFGHAVDTLFLDWLAGHLDRITVPRVFATAALFTAVCELAYVSAVTVLPVFLGLLAGAVLLEPRLDRRAGDGWASEGSTSAAARTRAAAVLAFAIAGSLLAVAVYYRDFVGVIVDVVPRMATDAPGGAGDHAPVQGVRELVFYNARLFGWVLPVTAVFGFGLLWRRGRRRALLLAWAASYLLLLVGRARLPDLFQHQHDALFAAPLVCLAAGEAVAWLFARGTLGRLAASALLVLAAAQGLVAQAGVWLQQLANAR
jgi:hypothetical protein